MNNGGLEAMLFDLLHRDIAGWHPRNLIKTAGLVDQQSRNLSPIDASWVEMIEADALQGGGDTPATAMIAPSNDWLSKEDGDGDLALPPKSKMHPGLYTHMRNVSPELKNVSDHVLGHELRERGCISVTNVPANRGRKRGWKFPPLHECREAWEKLHPGWPWPTPKEEWTEWQSPE